MEKQLIQTKKKIALAIDELEKLESLYFFEQLPTQSKRVRELIDIGIEILAEIASKSEPTFEDLIKINYFTNKYVREVDMADLDKYFQV